MRNLRFIVPSRIPCRFPKNPSSHASHSRAAMQGSLGRVELGLLGLLGTSLARQPRRPRHPLGLNYACHPLSITNHTRILMTSCSLRLHTILRLGIMYWIRRSWARVYLNISLIIFAVPNPLLASFLSLSYFASPVVLLLVADIVFQTSLRIPPSSLKIQVPLALSSPS